MNRPIQDDATRPGRPTRRWINKLSFGVLPR
jgi:hypothetical protein